MLPPANNGVRELPIRPWTKVRWKRHERMREVTFVPIASIFDATPCLQCT